MSYVTRNIENEIDKLLPLPQIISIIGPRRCGKTTLLMHLKDLLSNSIYLSFENQKVLELFDTDIEIFTKLYVENYKYIILDEFHYAKNGGKQLKYIYDFFPGKKILVSGSSSIELTIQAVKHLVGRIIVLNLYPFSFDEFIRLKNPELYSVYLDFKIKLKNDESLNISTPVSEMFNLLLTEYLLFGGYPEVILQEELSIKKTLLTNIYSIYFLREVKDLLDLTDDYKLKLLLKSLSLQIGNIFAYNELSSISNTTLPTLKKYLNFFEKTFITFYIPPYFTNKRVELVKNPKIYFWDTGLRNSVIDNFSELSKRTDAGSLRENFAAISLEKRGQLNFWRTKSGAEVDFILEKDGQTFAYEVKSNMRTATIPKSIHSFLSKYELKDAIVFTNDLYAEVSYNGKKVKFLPLFLI